MKTCAICAANMDDNKCPCCGWIDRGVVKLDTFWLYIHMCWLLLVITHVESLLV